MCCLEMAAWLHKKQAPTVQHSPCRWPYFRRCIPWYAGFDPQPGCREDISQSGASTLAINLG